MENSDKLLSTVFSSWNPPDAKMEIGSCLDGKEEYCLFDPIIDVIVIHYTNQDVTKPTEIFRSKLIMDD